MRDRRTQERVLILRTGRIVSVPTSVEMETAVLDISDGGACLLVADINEVPETFRLLLDSGPEAHDCEVRWKAGHRIGIRFQE